jgi:queuine tRNA-ribosyltransferase
LKYTAKLDAGFRVEHTDGGARTGKLETAHGSVPTPVFMPVGTQGTVKALAQRELIESGALIILSNTYHLYLRPGRDVLLASGGLHRFASWDRAILTDSGGFQVYSLSDLRQVDDTGVVFRSHLDGSTHEFTPEYVIDTQRIIGADIMMQLDECVAADAPRGTVVGAMERSLKWAERSIAAFQQYKPLYGYRQMLFGIVQGGTYDDLREESAVSLAAMPFDGYAIGGLAVGEPVEEMYRVTEFTAGMLPRDKPRYLMGVGTPENLLTAIGLGVDMFDCVMPTRNARNGMIFTSKGPLNIRNARFRTDRAPIDGRCGCYTCCHFKRMYIRHLFMAKEILGLQLATIHNVSFYLNLMRGAREAIAQNRYRSWMESMLSAMNEYAE